MDIFRRKLMLVTNGTQRVKVKLGEIRDLIESMHWMQDSANINQM